MSKLDDVRRILKIHRNELRTRFAVKTIAIFGSLVRGENRRDSDIDVLVEFDSPISLLKLVSVENHLSDLLGVRVDVVPKNDLRPELKEEILQEAVTV